MRWTSDSCAATTRIRLDRALQRIGTRVELPAIGRERPHPLVAASGRRCALAATNELFTDAVVFEATLLEVRVPRLRLCGAA